MRMLVFLATVWHVTHQANQSQSQDFLGSYLRRDDLSAVFVQPIVCTSGTVEAIVPRTWGMPSENEANTEDDRDQTWPETNS